MPPAPRAADPQDAEGCSSRAHLEVSVHDPHLVTVQDGLQDLLDAVAAGKQPRGQQAPPAPDPPHCGGTATPNPDAKPNPDPKPQP